MMEKLKPQLLEQENLEAELEALRKERWNLEKITELETMKKGLLEDAGALAINDEAAAMEACNPFVVGIEDKAGPSQAVLDMVKESGEVDPEAAIRETM